MLTVIEDNDYDGIDLDWEYPDTEQEIPGFERLVRRFRQELDELGRKQGKAMVQTMAVSSNPGTLRWLKKEVLLETMDWLNVMTYDYAGTWTPYAGHNAPLFASSKQPGGTPRSTELTLEYLVKERGCHPTSWRWGFPSMAGVSPWPSRMPQPGTPLPTDRAGGGNYSNIDRLLKQGWTRRWDDETKNPWLIVADRSSVIGYDDVESVSLKTDWTMKQGFRGVFFWQIGGDLLPDGTNPLQEAAHKKWLENRQKRAENRPSPTATPATASTTPGGYQFDGTIARQVLENYLSRSITMEGLLNGRGDLDDNTRMLTHIGAKFIGRSLCLWGDEANLLRNLERARQQVPVLHKADPEMILQACVFEIVTDQVDQVPVPDWAFKALGRPVEKRNFRYTDDALSRRPATRTNGAGTAPSRTSAGRRPSSGFTSWRPHTSISGIEAIHFGQAEMMNGNDPRLDHWSEILRPGPAARGQACASAHGALRFARSQRRPRPGRPATDGFPLVPAADQGSSPTARMRRFWKVGFSDGIYGRSQGGMTPSGWPCEHLPYLVEIDNWGASRHPGAGEGRRDLGLGLRRNHLVRPSDEEYRADWLRYAWDWVRRPTRTATLRCPAAARSIAPGQHALVPRQHARSRRSRGLRTGRNHSRHLGRGGPKP